MSRSRLIGFIAVMILGILAGILYGWVIQPAAVSNTSLNSLRADYKADYVLMVAENYQALHDLDTATSDLNRISTKSALDAVQQAILDAQKLGYSISDLKLMADLETALRSGTPSGGNTP